ncbi:MAG: hypothetical protein EOO99_08730 [Pedobacter sp.]|nr:MAG: hypothetical protein EOO99_08730 [Pedobacter sp.]
MGIINLGLLSPVSGKVGPLVGANFRGLNVLRAKPKKSQKAPSPLQLDQRMRFSLAVTFISAMKSIVKDYYGNKAGVRSKLNRCVSYHAKEAITGVYPNLAIDFDKVIFTKGELENSNAHMANEVRHKIDINWANNEGTGFSKGSDRTIVVLYNADQKKFVWQLSTVERSVETIQIELPNSYNGDVIHGWISFCSADQQMVATSNYLGSITLS